MKQVFTLLLTVQFLSLIGQVGPCTINGGSEIVDIYLKEDALPDNFDIGQIGEGNYWITNLQSPRTNTYKYTKASEGRYNAFFPDAEMVLREPLGREKYFIIRGAKWFEIGFATISKNSIEPSISIYSVPVTACVPYDKSRLHKYQTSFDQDGERSTISYDDIKDASGVLYLPDAYYDASRVKRIKTISTGSSVVIQTSYIFVDQLTNEFLMEAFVDDSEQVERVVYKTSTPPKSQRSISDKNSFLLYPNTGYGEVRLEFKSFTPGRYRLFLFDLVGRQLWSTSYMIDGDITLKEDLSFLPRGTYTYTIVDAHQNKVVTRRLAIIKS